MNGSQRESGIKRRQWLAASAGAVWTVAIPGAAWAQQGYPSRPIRIVVPFPAGGATDVVARLIGERLSTRLGQPVIVDNKGGAGGISGTDFVAKAAPDGYTLVLSLSTSLLINQYLFDKLPYDPRKDLALVSKIAVAPVVLVAHPSVPVKNGAELMEYIARNKGKVSYGSWGPGSYAHLAGAAMSLKQDADMAHVAYKGEAPMLQDLIGGQIQFAYAGALGAKPHIDSGRLKILGVTGTQRMAAQPNVPTMAEQGLKDEVFKVMGFIGMAAPAKTPKDVVHRIAAEVKAICAMPEVAERISSMGFTVAADTPEAFEASYRADAPVWERLVKQSGAKLD